MNLHEEFIIFFFLKVFQNTRGAKKKKKLSLFLVDAFMVNQIYSPFQKHSGSGLEILHFLKNEHE